MQYSEAKEIRHKVDKYSVEVYAKDNKGDRTRWADKIIRLYSKDKEVARAVFSSEGHDVPEPYYSESDDLIYFYARGSQFSAVLDVLRNHDPVYIVWRPVADDRETGDGDAFFVSEVRKNK